MRIVLVVAVVAASFALVGLALRSDPQRAGQPAQVRSPSPQRSGQRAEVPSPAAQDWRLPAPRPDEVRAHRLPDDTPVFAVRQPGGSVDVLVAEAPFGDLDATGIAWCPAAERFVQVWSGSQFRRDGTYLSGPTPTGMARYEARLDGDEVQVGARVEGPPRGAPSPHDPGGPPEACWAKDGGQDLDLDHVLSHAGPHSDAITVEELGSIADGTVTVRGVFLPRSDGAVELCDELAHDDPPVCLDPLVRPGDGDHREVGDGYEGWASVTMRDGRPVRVVLAAMEQLAGWEEPVPDDRIRVEGEDGRVLTVPAFDIHFGRPLDRSIPSGPWRVQLVNHGELVHGLRIDPGIVHVGPGNAFISITEPFDLPPGEHVVYCPVPGHREAGMEVVVTVE